MTLQIADLEHFGQTALLEFDRELARRTPSDEAEFERQAQRLEAKLEQLYALAATMAQREANLPGVVAIWAGMVGVCDQMAKTLAASPHTARRSESYDRILDIRNLCEENRALHA